MLSDNIEGVVMILFLYLSQPLRGDQDIFLVTFSGSFIFSIFIYSQWPGLRNALAEYNGDDSVQM